MLKRRLLLLLFFGLGLALTMVGRDMLARATAPPPPPQQPQRIVSLAPSVTETLFALGLGKQVVGVTHFCRYPEEAAALPKVAGFSDVNYEAVVRQNPDLVALPVDKLRSREGLTRLGFNTLTLDTSSITELLATIAQLGEATGHTETAAAVISRLTQAMDEARATAKGQPRPRVLFSVMHNAENMGYITEINAVGKDGFFNELIEIAGGQNAYEGSLAFPRLSREAILFLKPDVIIDIVPDILDLEEARHRWNSLSSVPAIKNNRLVLITDRSATIPGPRLDQTLATLSRAFHPKNVKNPDNPVSRKIPKNPERP